MEALAALVQSAVDTGIFKEAREPKELVTGGGREGSGKTPTLMELCTDLTEEAEAGNIDPVIGRKVRGRGEGRSLGKGDIFFVFTN